MPNYASKIKAFDSGENRDLRDALPSWDEAWPASRTGLTDVTGSGADGTPDGDAELLALFEILGRRWALRVVWELRADGQTYRDLAAKVPDMSTSVLTQRLRDLRAASLVEHKRGSGYQLTTLGRELLTHLETLRAWAEQVGFAPGLSAQ